MFLNCEQYPETVGETDEKRCFVPEDLPGPGPELRPLDGGGGGGGMGGGRGEVEEEQEEQRHGHTGLDDHVVVNIPLNVGNFGTVRS